MKSEDSHVEESGGHIMDLHGADASGARLFIAGLPSSADTTWLSQAFAGYGDICDVRVVRPGLGYVVFTSPLDASNALEKMQV